MSASDSRPELSDTLPVDASTGDPDAPSEFAGDVPRRIGRFTVLGHIGAGGMGTVYSAFDDALDRRIAIKLVLGRNRSEATAARMQREAQAMARLSHPNVVQVYEVGTHDGDVFVAMEFVRGISLRAWSEAEERSWREVVRIYAQAGEGLAAAHEAGLVHRDFKPENAILGEDGRVRVLDLRAGPG